MVQHGILEQHGILLQHGILELHGILEQHVSGYLGPVGAVSAALARCGAERPGRGVFVVG